MITPASSTLNSISIFSRLVPHRSVISYCLAAVEMMQHQVTIHYESDGQDKPPTANNNNSSKCRTAQKGITENSLTVWKRRYQNH